MSIVTGISSEPVEVLASSPWEENFYAVAVCLPSAVACRTLCVAATRVETMPQTASLNFPPPLTRGHSTGSPESVTIPFTTSRLNGRLDNPRTRGAA